VLFGDFLTWVAFWRVFSRSRLSGTHVLAIRHTHSITISN
jgi:hypothetical protein